MPRRTVGLHGSEPYLPMQSHKNYFGSCTGASGVALGISPYMMLTYAADQALWMVFTVLDSHQG